VRVKSTVLYCVYVVVVVSYFCFLLFSLSTLSMLSVLIRSMSTPKGCLTKHLTKHLIYYIYMIKEARFGQEGALFP
jgi:hypothetical protein